MKEIGDVNQNIIWINQDVDTSRMIPNYTSVFMDGPIAVTVNNYDNNQVLNNICSKLKRAISRIMNCA